MRIISKRGVKTHSEHAKSKGLPLSVSALGHARASERSLRKYSFMHYNLANCNKQSSSAQKSILYKTSKQLTIEPLES